MSIALILTGASVALLTGCGGVQPPGGSRDPALTTTGFGLPDEIAKVRVASFRAKYPDVPLRITEGHLDEQQFLSSVAVKQPSDVVYLERLQVGSYASRGAIQPLDWCVRDQHVDVGAFRPSAVAEATLGGRLYALPDFNQVRVVIVNNTALRQVGLDPASFATGDWARLTELGAQLTVRSGGRLSRIGFDPKVPEMLPMWARAAGVDLVDGEGGPRLDDPKVVEAVTATAEMVRRQASWTDFRAFRQTFDLFGAKNPYVAGQLGAMPIETWLLNSLAATSPNADITVLPFTDRTGQPLTWGTGSGWAIPKGARHPRQACEFIAHMTNADTWVEAARARKQALTAKKKPYTGTYTGNRVADERIFADVYEPVPYPAIAEGVRVALAVQDHAFAQRPSPVGAELKTAYESAVARVLLGQQAPKDALVQAQREAEDALTWRRS
ncbi:MAG TPA: extracellular solute-binding protein [Planosporangium sp.]|nr:extracellular solute-binding protein [Planosporangium sp.]